MSVGSEGAEAGLAIGQTGTADVYIEDDEAYSPQLQRSLGRSDSGTESDSNPGNNPNNGGNSGNNNGNSVNGGTCATYTVTVLPGYGANYTNEFAYRISGGAAQRLGIVNTDVGQSRTVQNSGSIQFGIYVQNRDYYRWDPRIVGNEYRFEDIDDNDYDDAILRVTGSSC